MARREYVSQVAIEATSRTPKDVEYLRREIRSGRVREHAYATLVGLKTYDTVKLLERVEAGLTYRAFERLRTNLNLSMNRLADLLRIPPRTLARRKAQGRLLPAESDRLLRLSRIVSRTLDLFEGDFHTARAWLFNPQLALGGSKPIEFAKTDLGSREVEDLIGRLEHGIPA